MYEDFISSSMFTLIILSWFSNFLVFYVFYNTFEACRHKSPKGTQKIVHEQLYARIFNKVLTSFLFDVRTLWHDVENGM